MTREERYNQLLRVAGSKDGMLQLQSLRQRLCGQTPVSNDDSLERLIKEIFDAESPPMHFTAHHHGTDKLAKSELESLSLPKFITMKKQAKKTVRKTTKHKWPETIEHHRFGTLRLLKDEYHNIFEWCGRTIDFTVLGLNKELSDEDSVRQILDAASILLINEAGWRKRFEALIKQDIDAGSLDHWKLKPRDKSQLSKSFEPSSVYVSWSDNYELLLYIYLEVTSPIVADAPTSSNWYIKLNLEPHCSWIEMKLGD